MPGAHAVCTASHDAPDGPIVCMGVKEGDQGQRLGSRTEIAEGRLTQVGGTNVDGR